MKNPSWEAQEDLWGEDEITCPNCGTILGGGDSHEASDYGETTCENCGKKYSWERIVSVDYSTKIMK